MIARTMIIVAMIMGVVEAMVITMIPMIARITLSSCESVITRVSTAASIECGLPCRTKLR